MQQEQVFLHCGIHIPLSTQFAQNFRSAPKFSAKPLVGRSLVLPFCSPNINYDVPKKLLYIMFVSILCIPITSHSQFIFGLRNSWLCTTQTIHCRNGMAHSATCRCRRHLDLAVVVADNRAKCRPNCVDPTGSAAQAHLDARIDCLPVGNPAETESMVTAAKMSALCCGLLAIELKVGDWIWIG